MNVVFKIFKTKWWLHYPLISPWWPWNLSRLSVMSQSSVEISCNLLSCPFCSFRNFCRDCKKGLKFGFISDNDSSFNMLQLHLGVSRNCANKSIYNRVQSVVGKLLKLWFKSSFINVFHPKFGYYFCWPIHNNLTLWFCNVDAFHTFLDPLTEPDCFELHNK